MSNSTYLHIHESLFNWWRTAGRILPWREKIKEKRRLQQKVDIPSELLRETEFSDYFESSLKRDPYRVVVAEMMLQQTQVDRVFSKYLGWMEKWPTITDLARASLSEVIIFWQGLGYNRRARFLWLLAKEIGEVRQGTWPTTEEELIKLPGIGKYTARAILSFAFGYQVGVVDTNVKRILDRVLRGEDKSLENYSVLSERKYFELADEFLPHEQADPWNQAIMDFGALICTARSPKCSDCPLFDACQVNQLAIKKGFTHFQAMQKEALSNESSRLVKKKNLVPFHETDRYFRGRIVDELRNASLSEEKLAQILENEYGLSDRERFVLLLQKLINEGILAKNGKIISIG